MNLPLRLILLIAFSLIIILSISFALGIGTFISLQNEEQRHALFMYHNQVHSVHGFFTSHNDLVHPYEQFIPFMEDMKPISSIGWIVTIQDDDRDTFIARMRAFGGLYEHFDIRINGSIAPRYPSYNVLTYVYPLDDMVGTLMPMNGTLSIDDVYFSTFTSPIKWVLLIVIVVTSCMMVGILVGTGIYMISQWTHLEKSYIHKNIAGRYKLLMNQIANLEEVYRCTLDRIPYPIVIVDKEGKISYMNMSMELISGYSLSTNVHTILPDIPLDTGDVCMGTIKPRIGIRIPISYTCIKVDRQELYMIIVHEHKYSHIGDVQLSEFEIRWRDDEEFRDQMVQFCHKDRNSENIEFLIDIDQYRKCTSFDQRVDLQDKILSTYFSINCVKQLNLPGDLVQDIHDRSATSIGDVHLFDQAESVVKFTFITDIYPRYQK